MVTRQLSAGIGACAPPSSCDGAVLMARSEGLGWRSWHMLMQATVSPGL